MSLKNDENNIDELNSDNKGEELEMTPERKAYIEKYGSEDGAAPGWDAIDAALRKVYPDTVERHYGTVIKYFLGGKDPLDGISIYDNPSQVFHYLHFPVHNKAQTFQS